jgi:hypothetical protein
VIDSEGTLHESEQLFAARYVTWLPTVEELQRELARERHLLEARPGGRGKKGGA